MTNPTSNYGWVLPTSTDLVTDLPADFEVALQGVDTTTKNLNPQTTTGALAYRSATANVNTALPIGTTGQVLTVASGVPSWATASAGGMTSIATGTLSGTAVAITSIPGTYKHLQLVVRNYQPSLDTLMTIRLNNDSAARYAFSNSSYSTGAFGSNEGRFSEDSDNGTSYGLIVADFYDYANTSTWKRLNSMAMTNAAATPTNYTFIEYKTFYNQTAAISQINLQTNIYNASATFSGGTYTLYGVS